MDRNQKQRLIIALLLVGAIVLAILLRPKPKDSEPDEHDYYTGPRRSKFDPNVWVTADGKIVPAPAGEATLPPAANATKNKLGGE